MKRKTVRFAAILLIALLPLTACQPNTPAPLAEGETYLDGTWSNDDLRVAYNFHPDGGGTLYVGGKVLLIRYGVKGDTLFLQTGGETDTHTFETDGEDLLLDGLRFRPVGDDPAVEAEVSLALAQAQSTADAEASANRTRTVLLLVTLLAAVGSVAILARYIRGKKGKKKSFLFRKNRR